MIVRIARVLSACMMFFTLSGVRPAVCEAASLLTPVSSALNKVGAGTKSLLTKTGQTVGLIKTPKVKKPKWPTGKTPPPKNWNQKA